MKRLTVGAFVAAQLLGTAQPAFAADLATGQEIRGGAFGGVQLRIPLGGASRGHRVRAGLTLAPTLQNRAATGEVRTRIGEGLEFGYRSNRPLSFSLAGQDLSGRRLGAAQDNDDDHRGFPVGRVLLAVGAVVVTAAIAAALAANHILDNERRGPDGS